MRNLKRCCALILSCCMLFSLLTVSASAMEYTTIVNDPNRYTDLKGHWAEEALTNALCNGIMVGTTNTTVSPDAPVTRAQMATLIVRAFEATKTSNISAFVDCNKDAWYYNYVSQAVQMGILSGNGNSMNPYSHITRQEAACVLCRAFNLYGYTANLGQYADGGSVASYARDSVAACLGAGVITTNDGKINPTAELTRADFTYAMYKVVQNYVSSQVPFSGAGTINGSIMVTTPNIALNNTTVTGNMYIGDGVENGAITLDNVQVNGTIYVRGGSKLYLNNSSTAGSIVVFNPSYAVSVELDKTSSTRSTVIDTAISGVTVSGRVGDIKMNTAKAVLNLKGATAGTLDTNIILPTITVDKDSTLNNLNIPSVADGANVTIEGKVRNINCDADSVEMSIDKAADVIDLDISGDDGKYTLGGTFDDVTLSGKAADNELSITADAEVATFNINTSNSNDISVASGADMDEILFNQARSRITTTLKAEDVRIGEKADDSKFTFDGKSDIDELTVDGDDVTINVGKDSTIDTIVVNGKNVTITGKGKVGNIVLRRGATGAEIDIPSTKVENNSGSSADVGGDRLPSGSTGSTDDKGDLDDSITGETPKNPDEDDGKIYASKFSIEFPSDATAYDIYGSGMFNLTDLVLSGGYNSSTQQLSGTVRPVANFSPMLDNGAASTGFYFPLAMNSSDRTADFTLTVGPKTFTQADLSVGPRYKNRLIFFVPLTVDDYSKKVTIIYDADGSGTKYTPATANLFFGEVKFEKDETIKKRAALVTNAPGIGGAEALSVSGFTALSDYSFSYNLSCSNLTKTKNSEEKEGYWGGVTVFGPKDAMLVTYTVTTNKGSEEFTTGLMLGTANTSFEYYHDMEDIQFIDMQVTWKDGQNQAIGPMETYRFNTSGVKLDGSSSGGQTPVEPTQTPVASSITIDKYPTAALKADTGKDISDFAEAYNVLNSSGTNEDGAIAGTYRPVALTSGKGPYVPLKVIVYDLKSSASIYANGKLMGNLEWKEEFANGTDPAVNILVPLTVLGAQVKDFDIEVRPTGATSADSNVVYTTATKHVSSSQAAYVEQMTSFSKVTSGTFFGNTLGALITSGYDVVTNGTGYDFKGAYAKVTADGTCTLTNKTGWFAPVKVTNISEGSTAWSVEVTAPKGKTGEVETYTYNVAASTTNLDIAVPLGYYNDDEDSEFFTRVSVIVKDGAGEVVTTIYVDASSCTLTGMPEGKTGIALGETGTPPIKPEPVVPATASLEVLTSGTIDALNVTDFFGDSVPVLAPSSEEGSYAVTGTLKKTTLKNGAEGWALPLNVMLDKEAGAVWDVTVAGQVNDSYRLQAADSTSCKIFVPIAVAATEEGNADSRVATATITISGLKSATSNTVFTLSFTYEDDGLVLTDFVAEVTPGNDGDTDVSEP